MEQPNFPQKNASNRQRAYDRITQLMSELEATIPPPSVLKHHGNQQQDPHDFRLNVLSMRRLDTGVIRVNKHELDICKWNLQETPEYWHAVNSAIRMYMGYRGEVALIHTVADVIGWNLSRFSHPVRDAKTLQNACLLSYRGQDGGGWFSYFDVRTREYAYGAVSIPQMDSLSEMAKCPVRREDLKELFQSNGRPLGGHEKDRTLCILGGRHPETRPDSSFPHGPTRQF